ncbi:MAG: hypothetical protein ACTHU0_22935 [Kofleriaceae bacterium]
MIRAGVVAAAVLGLAGCIDEDGPRLDHAEPAAARAGEIVTLSGRGLCGVSADCATAGGSVVLGLEPPAVHAVVLAYSETRAQIRIPDVAPVGRTALVVTVNERSSNALPFEVLP